MSLKRLKRVNLPVSNVSSHSCILFSSNALDEAMGEPQGVWVSVLLVVGLFFSFPVFTSKGSPFVIHSYIVFLGRMGRAGSRFTTQHYRSMQLHCMRNAPGHFAWALGLAEQIHSMAW
jgi:hypothetical protein